MRPASNHQADVEAWRKVLAVRPHAKVFYRRLFLTISRKTPGMLELLSTNKWWWADGTEPLIPIPGAWARRHKRNWRDIYINALSERYGIEGFDVWGIHRWDEKWRAKRRKCQRGHSIGLLAQIMLAVMRGGR